MGQVGSSREGAPCLADKIVLPVCGHRGSEEGISWGREDAFRFSINRFSVDNNLLVGWQHPVGVREHFAGAYLL